MKTKSDHCHEFSPRVEEARICSDHGTSEATVMALVELQQGSSLLLPVASNARAKSSPSQSSETELEEKLRPVCIGEGTRRLLTSKVGLDLGKMSAL